MPILGTERKLSHLISFRVNFVPFAAPASAYSIFSAALHRRGISLTAPHSPPPAHLISVIICSLSRAHTLRFILHQFHFLHLFHLISSNLLALRSAAGVCVRHRNLCVIVSTGIRSTFMFLSRSLSCSRPCSALSRERKKAIESAKKGELRTPDVFLSFVR